MKSFKFIILFLAIVSINSSCTKKFLDVKDNSVVIRQQYVTDLKSTETFLRGIYIVLSAEFYKANNQIYADVIADDIKPVIGGSKLIDVYNWSQRADISSSTDGNVIWNKGYQIIRSCSFVLEKAEEYRSQNTSLADNMKAQAYALRALMHSYLVSIFAQPYSFTANASHVGIPYVTNSDWTQPVSRQSVSEVYVDMITDLTNSLKLFSPGAINVKLMNINAAKALLARIYLFKGDYQAAKNIAREVVTVVPIMDNGDYPLKLFTNQNVEALFHLQPEMINYYTDYSGLYFSQDYWLQFVATTDIADMLQQNANDVRKAWVTSNGGDWHITKFPKGVDPNYSSPAGSYYQTIVRSSEMDLILAESYANLNKEDSARYYLDEIRIRANPLATVSTASGAALLDSIYNERRKELAFEGLRMFDLLRWKKGVNRIDALTPEAKTLPYPSSKSIAPIPELDVKVSGLPQNLGY